jgi:hypothetical protein
MVKEGINMESNMKNLLSSLEKDSEDIKAYKIKLNHDLSVADQKITDIYHYIEFHPLNACQGYKMAKLLQDTLKERREIKNEIDILDQIYGFNLKSIANGKLEKASKTKQKKYKPRVLKELFK